MKKYLLIVTLLLCAMVFVPQAFARETLVIGVTHYPHKDIIEVARPLLEAQGYDVKIKEFTDYVQPNIALANKLLFANFFQHKPYLENMNKEKDLKLIAIANVHIEPLGMYSKKIKSLTELKKGDKISVPNDPTNEARALRLLEAKGVIGVASGSLVTVADIEKNPLGLKFYELEAAQLPRALDDVTLAVINTNFAGEAGLIPTRDALALEDKDSPYANIIAIREEDRDSPMAKALVKAVQSKEVRAYIKRELDEKGIIPAF